MLNIFAVSSSTVSSSAVVAADDPHYSELVDSAAREFLARRDRDSHPAGRFDDGGRWRPADEEKCACCAHIRKPSRRWPYSLLVHCRTAEHVASLYKVDPADVRKRAREIEKAGGASK